MSDSNELELKGRYKLTKAWVRTELIRSLAEGKISQTDLAKRYGVGQSGIAEFKRRHAVDIERLKDSLNDEWADLWATKKRNRIAELECLFDTVSDGPLTPTVIRELRGILRDIAEEMGDITNKNKVEVDVVRYEISGVSLENLK